MRRFLFLIMLITLTCSINVYADDEYVNSEYYYEMEQSAASDVNDKYIVWYGCNSFYDSYSGQTLIVFKKIRLITSSNTTNSYAYPGTDGLYIERNPNCQYCILVSTGTSYNADTGKTTTIYVPTVCVYDGSNIYYDGPSYSFNVNYDSKRWYESNSIIYSGSMSSGKPLEGILVYEDNSTVSTLNSNVYVSSFGSNVACFSSKEAVENYFMTGDFSEATFYPDKLRDYYVDLEVPKDIQITYADGLLDVNPNYKITWSQTDEAYINWDTEFLCYFDFAWRGAVLGISFADWKYVNDNFLVDDKIPSYKLKYHLDNNGKYSNDIMFNYLADKGGSVSTVSAYDVYMRNRYVDADTGKLHISNWVHIRIEDGEVIYNDSDEGNVDITYTEIQGSVSDGDVSKPQGTIIPDNGYDGSPSSTTLNQNAADLVGYISSGMGLTGDSGVIDLLAATFVYVPEEIWIIITLGVSLFVVIGIVKFVRG